MPLDENNEKKIIKAVSNRATDLHCIIGQQHNLTQCHPNAQCILSNTTSNNNCCECNESYIGNGVECVLKSLCLIKKN